MKRYEERLLEDMASDRWRIQLSPPPAIYHLPVELLLQILEQCREEPRVFTSLRLVSKRMNVVATPFAFHNISLLQNRSPSLAPTLPYLMKKNSALAVACHALVFEIGHHRLARDLVDKRPTTRPVDVAQSVLLLMTPNLRTLTIKFLNVLNIQVRAEDESLDERIGFSRTINAISQCNHLRELNIRIDQTWDVDATRQLARRCWHAAADFITSASLTGDGYSQLVLGPLNGLIRDFPVFRRVEEFRIGFLNDMPFQTLCALFTKHLPNLKKLTVDGGGQAYSGPRGEGDASAIIERETPLETLIYKHCARGPRWLSSIPTRQLHFELTWNSHFFILQHLFETLQSHRGIFEKKIVRQILIDVERPRWDQKFEVIPKDLPETLDLQSFVPTEDPEVTFLESIQKICVDKGIYCKVRTTDCEPSYEYLYALSMYFKYR